MTIAIVAEKPSVARDIAAVVGASERGEGCFEGNGHIVTWAIGHLVTLAQPHEINPSWKRWSLDTLPMLPREFPLVVVPDTRSQFAAVRRILKAREVERVVCATDAGREGELIFRYIYEAAGCKKPVSRLWISSLTPDAIRHGFRNLRNSAEYDGLAAAAKGRSRADWLVGMNLSRAYSLTLDQEISVGRVQTPTLAIVVERDLAIRRFVPEDYLEVVATFAPHEPQSTQSALSYEGTWFRLPEQKSRADDTPLALRKRLPADGVEAATVVERARSGDAMVESVRAETRKFPPPLLYDLTELQRHANRLYGMSAQKTLTIAQSLYERHKLLTYPRTDSRHLSSEIARTLPRIVEAIASRYPGSIAADTGKRPLSRRFVDDSKVTDHHAIIPTGTVARTLSADELKIYDLVCRRLLEAWHDDHIFSVTTVVTTITSRGNEPVVDHYTSRGTAVEQLGWKVLDIGAGRKTTRTGKRGKDDDESLEEPEEDQSLPAGLARGQRRRVLQAKPVSKRTRPPKHHTEASLLTAMEHAGQELEEKELSDAMRDLGLGTPATRAQIIETLLRREYLIRRKKFLEATDKGIGLIEVVHPEVRSPAMTGEWEAKLKRLQRGQGQLDGFMGDIEAYVSEVVARVANGVIPATPTDPTRPSPSAPKPALEARGVDSTADRARVARQALLEQGAELPDGSLAQRDAREAHTPRAARPRPAVNRSTEFEVRAGVLETQPRRPTASTELGQLLRSSFGFSNFRPYQETVCRAATEGHDLLLVMPTGAGKSLCYQLPGIARAGTTLVVSPLIALMDDQAEKLTAQGFRAARIHSGRARSESRQACVDYLAGHLDFLFIAPERLRVPGFSELLAKRTPALVAIDEAHCISQWGHDFRPEYRMLGQRLPSLRPAPIIALTATATPRVQDDIVEQLGLRHALRFIHGFRRTNIAIEVVELKPGARPDVVCQILADRARRPAIVYAATRKSAEELGSALGGKRAAVYHAGMDAQTRERIQSAFLSGKCEIIVATVAFGMGIDKANVRTIIHAALPGSLEAYYQEIGRAGRDGLPSAAILMHSYIDRKTHEYFRDRDYPEPGVLEAIFAALGKNPVAPDTLRERMSFDDDEFERALEKLKLHAGACVTAEGDLVRGSEAWKPPYLAQRRHKSEQLSLMGGFAGSQDCRMVHLIRHFGDQEDSHAQCGICDVCAPERLLTPVTRAPDPSDQAAGARILAALSGEDGQPKGRLYRDAFAESGLSRRAYESVLQVLRREGLVIVSADSFERDGQEIRYERVNLTPSGRQYLASHEHDAMGALDARRMPDAERPRGAGRRRETKAPSPAQSKTQAQSKTRTRSKTKAQSKTQAQSRTRTKWFFVNRAKRAKKGKS